MTMILYELVGRDPSRPFSPHCWKARMALKHKGLDFQTEPVPFTGIGDIEGGASKTVPVLRDGDRVISDSFAIAEYLEDTYPDRPSLFRGEGGRAVSRFIETWAQRTLHPGVTGLAVMEIHDFLGETDRRYFRESRETRLGRTLESVAEGREGRVDAFLKLLEPLRTTLERQPFVGGEAPLFADYIVFGLLQWMRIVSQMRVLPADDPVTQWFERCLDLYEGHGRSVRAAA